MGINYNISNYMKIKTVLLSLLQRNIKFNLFYMCNASSCVCAYVY